jgi:hypothetical protein
MATGALFIGWGPAVVGREQKAIQVFGEALAYWGQLQARGVVDSFEPIQLMPHGGDLSGFMLAKGDEAKLAALMLDPEFTALNGRAQLVVTNFGVVLGYTGEGLQKLFEGFGQAAAELA